MQRTIKKAVGISGVGLHKGCQVKLKLKPAPANTGIIFRRVDLQKFEIEAIRDRVSRVVLATTLMKKGVMLSTVEHLLSALYGIGLDNVYIDIDSLEVPILDGSALPFVKMVKKAGIQEQNKKRTYLKVTKPVRLEDGDKFISIEPCSTFRISYQINFDHPAIGHQSLDMELTTRAYTQEIAYARTFGFYSEVEELRRKGLIRGGSFDNAVVLSETEIMNGPLRSPDEFVRHKMLDLIGDISLCGYPLIGHIKAHRTGHALHTDLATVLARDESICRKVQEPEVISQAVNF
jgi:UDP-3-O-[3-hydroxymyristoyl] N-acetylglucosamine deacetylase